MAAVRGGCNSSHRYLIIFAAGTVMLRYSEASGPFALSSQMLRSTCSENVAISCRVGVLAHHVAHGGRVRPPYNSVFMFRVCGAAAWSLSMTDFENSTF